MLRGLRFRDLAATGLALLLLITGVTVGVGGASAGPSGPGWGSGAGLVEPKDDPFYRPPAGFESSPPGTVLATRPVTVTGLGLPVPTDAQQFLVRSSDAKDAPTTVVGTLMVPRAPYPFGDRPLVSYQPATDSLGDQCNPSYKLRAGTEYELPLMMQALQNGWAVVVTDYQGPQMAFTAGRMAGHGVLDGVRGALALPDTGLNGVETPVGMWGYSGGGLATSWAAQLHPAYASELNIVGVASGGTPGDFEAAARQIDGGIASGLVMLAATGLTRAYPEMLSLLNDAGRRMLERIGDMCIGEAVSAFPFRHLNEFTTSKDPLAEPVARAVLKTNDLGQLPPRAPVFLFHSVWDELIPFASAQALQADWCRAGGKVALYADVLSEHSSLAVTGAPLAVTYLGSRFGGIDAPSTCP
ncbi:MAG TPA: lipase family protein [Acidimicrobiia bacterium]|nr:lipase family protein [Acidimicrobiia bacterium]